MYIDKDDFTAWMERIMDRFDMQDKKIDRVIKGRNCLVKNYWIIRIYACF